MPAEYLGLISPISVIKLVRTTGASRQVALSMRPVPKVSEGGLNKPAFWAAAEMSLLPLCL